MLAAPFPLVAQLPSSVPSSLPEFIEFGKQCENPKTQKEAILRLLSRRGQVEAFISSMTLGGDVERISQFGTAVNECYGVFYLLLYYFPPYLVKTWTTMSLPHLSGMPSIFPSTPSPHISYPLNIGACHSTVFSLNAAALGMSGEYAAMLTNIDTLLSLSKPQISAIADTIAPYLMAKISKIKKAPLHGEVEVQRQRGRDRK